MKMPKNPIVLRFGPTAVLAIGMIAFSQGMSFGRWNEFQSVGENHNLHAVLITLVGVGLFLNGLILRLILERLRSGNTDGD